MRRDKQLFNELLLRYRKYQKKLQRLEVTGSNVRRQGVLKRHIDRLKIKLETISAGLKLATVTAAMGGAMFLTATKAQAQTFQTGQQGQFGLTAGIGSYSRAVMVDIDGDGDLDVFGTGSVFDQISFFENTGSSTNPSFAEEVVNPFGLTVDGRYASLDFKDMDNDGDYDMIFVNSQGDFRYYENSGTSIAPSFDEGLATPLGLTDTDIYYGALAIVDLDGDGDYDIMAGDYVSPFQYFENIGSSSEPNFTTAVEDPFNFDDGSSFSYLAGVTFVDLDEDGDMDMFASDYIEENFLYYENIGTSSEPDFAVVQTDPFRLDVIDDVFFLLPYPGDLDGDGDMDLISGSNKGGCHFFENRFLNFEEEQVNPFGLTDLDNSDYSYTIPAMVDIDGDGDFDIFSGESYGNFHFFENIGTPASPLFDDKQTNVFGVAEGGGYKKSSFVDIDGDGDEDMFVSGSSADLYYYPNERTESEVVFGEVQTNPFDFVNSATSFYTSFADMDGDNDYDMIVGEGEGAFLYYENIGTAAVASFTTGIAILEDIGDLSTPEFVDIDKDGDYDVVAGEKDGNVYFFENIGSAFSYAFAAPIVNPFGLQEVNKGRNLRLSIKDIDNDGDEDLLVGDSNADFRFFEFTGPVFTSATHVSLDENIAEATSVEAADGVEDEDYTDLTYSIFGGADETLFALDESNGSLSFITLPDFENPHDADQDNVYEVSIRVYSAEMESANVQGLTITITDEIPSVTLTVTADNKSKTYGDNNPALTFTYDGFVEGDDESSLDEPVVVTTAASANSDAGTYAIAASGGASEDKYLFDYVDGTLTINQAALTASVTDAVIDQGDDLPTFIISYTGFVNSDDENVLDTAPTASVAIDDSSAGGNYPISVSGGVDNNYSFTYVNGTLTINQVLSTLTSQQINVYPNPVVNELEVTSSQVAYLSAYDMKGQQVLNTAVDGSIDVSGLQSGTYIIKLSDTSGAVVYTGRIIKN